MIRRLAHTLACLACIWCAAPAPASADGTVEGWIRDLASSDPERVRDAQDAIGDMGTSALLAVERMLRAPEPLDRINALGAVARFGVEAAPIFNAVYAALDDRSPGVQREALRAIGALGPHAAEAEKRLALVRTVARRQHRILREAPPDGTPDYANRIHDAALRWVRSDEALHAIAEQTVFGDLEDPARSGRRVTAWIDRLVARWRADASSRHFVIEGSLNLPAHMHLPFADGREIRISRFLHFVGALDVAHELLDGPPDGAPWSAAPGWNALRGAPARIAIPHLLRRLRMQLRIFELDVRDGSIVDLHPQLAVLIASWGTVAVPLLDAALAKGIERGDRHLLAAVCLAIAALRCDCKALVPNLVRVAMARIGRSRSYAMRLLARVGPAADGAVAPLVASWNRGDPVEKWVALYALAGLGTASKCVVPDIEAMLATGKQRFFLLEASWLRVVAHRVRHGAAGFSAALRDPEARLAALSWLAAERHRMRLPFDALLEVVRRAPGDEAALAARLLLRGGPDAVQQLRAKATTKSALAAVAAAAAPAWHRPTTARWGLSEIFEGAGLEPPSARTVWEVRAPLRVALDAPDPVVASDAAAALARLDHPTDEIAEPLVALLDAASPLVRGAAALALGRHAARDDETLEALRARLDDPELDVRVAVVHALSRAGDAAAADVPRMFASLDQGLARFVEAHEHHAGDADLSFDEAGGLSEWVDRGGPGFDALLDGLAHRTRWVRVLVATALARATRPNRRSVEALLGQIDDADDLAWDRFGWALQQIAPRVPGGVRRIAQELGSPNNRSQTRAAELLRWLGPDARPAVDELTTALEDPVVRVRRLAAETLGRIGYPARGSLLALQTTALDPVGEVRSEARRAVRAIRGAVLDPYY